MNFLFSDQQLLFQRTVREFLSKECSPTHVREMTIEGGVWSPRVWKALAELGVVGLTVPEAYGGLGKDELDLVLILEEAGRVALPERLLQTTAVAVPILRDHVAPELAGPWLERIAAGDAIAEYERTTADAFDVTFRRAPDDEPQRITATSSDVSTALSDAFDREAFASSAVLCGIGDRVVELAAAYAKERLQFGKPIGSFQAVKHLLADALLGIEFARPAVYRAAWSIARGRPARSRDVSMAKALASDAAFVACRAALQVHGAIGYTHEHDLHLWLTMGFSLSNAWGTAAWHRERIARDALG